MFTKTKNLIVVTIIAALLSVGCFKSKTEVKRVPNNSNQTMKDLKGVFYSLPRTVVTADVPIKRKEEKPGVLEKFTPCFYPPDIADERVREKKITFSIEDPTIAFRVEPDPEEHFLVSVKGGYFENKSLLMDYAPGGILQKGEASSENQALDFTIQAAKTATSIITGIAGIPHVPAARLLTIENKAALRDEDKAMLARLGRARVCYETIVDEKKRLLNEAEEALKKAKTPEEVEAATKEVCKAQKALIKAASEAKDVPEGAKDEAKAKGLDLIITKDDLQKEIDKKEKELRDKANSEPQEKLQEELQDLHQELDRLKELDAIASGQIGTLSSRSVSCPDDTNKEEEKKTPQELVSDYERAEQTFNDIKTLEQKRLDVIGGGDNTAGSILGASGLPSETLKTVLKELDTSIETRKALFFGTESGTPWTGKFEYSPTKLPLQAKGLFWFSETQGLCDTRLTKELGIIIPKKFRAKECPDIPANPSELQPAPAKMDIVFLRIKKDMADQDFRDQMARVQANLEAEKKERGWYYRIPAPALVILKRGSLKKEDLDRIGMSEDKALGFEQALLGLSTARNLGTNTLTVAQLGVTVSIPASGAGRTNQSTIEYDQAGALKNFKYSSNSLLQKSQLEEVQATAQTVIDAKKAGNEEKIKANDQLNKMKRELEILQTQNQINEEKKKLNQANANGNSNSSP